VYLLVLKRKNSFQKINFALHKILLTIPDISMTRNQFIDPEAKNLTPAEREYEKALRPTDFQALRVRKKSSRT